MRDARTSPTRLDLEHGGSVDECRIAYRVHGDPSEGPTTLVLGGISADRRVRRAHYEETDGWWDWAVVPGRALDPRTRAVLSLDWLGGPGDSTGTWNGCLDDEGVPLLSVNDLADTVALVLDAAGVSRLDSIVGSSFGGCVALAFAARHPERVDRLVVIGAAEAPSALAAAVRVVQRRIVRDALRRGQATAGVRLARALAVTTYRSEREFDRRFGVPPRLSAGEPRFSFEAYLDHQGDRFAETFSAEAFLALSRALDLHRVEPGDVRCAVTLVALDGDRVAPPWQLRRLAERLPSGRCVEVAAQVGHDAFLAEPEKIVPILDHALGVAGASA